MPRKCCRKLNLFLLTTCISISMLWFVIISSFNVKVTENSFHNASLSNDHENLNDSSAISDPMPARNDFIEFRGNISKLCNTNQSTDILIVIHSSVKHTVKRDTLRRTLGKYSNAFSLSYRLLFVVGLPANQEGLKEITEEASNHDDILFINAVDSYRNLTYKALGWIRWGAEYCSNYRYVLKTDDDTIVNLKVFTRIVSECENSNSTTGVCHQMSCNVWTTAKPFRGGKNKVTFEEYKHKIWPHMCPGIAYFLPQSIISSLWNASKLVRFLWLDDVFVTGILRQKANLTLHSLGNLYLDNTDYKFSHMVKKNKTFGHFNYRLNFAKKYPRIWCIINTIDNPNSC